MTTGRNPQTRARILRGLKLAGGSLLFVYVNFLLGFILLQERFILFPKRRLDRSPGDLGLAYDPVEFPAEDGVRLRGWFISGPRSRASAPRPVVMLCQGNGGNIGDRLPAIRGLHRIGCDLLLFDYRGFGRSDGRRPHEEALYQDSLAAWRYLAEKRKMDPGRIALYGQSLGCGVAAWLAANRRVGALILEGGFPSLPEAARIRFPWLPARLLMRPQYPAARYLKQVSCPVLVAHSAEDRDVPLRYGQQLFASARAPKTMVTLAGAHIHAWETMPDAYAAAVARFLAASMPGGILRAVSSRPLGRMPARGRASCASGGSF